MPFNLHFCFCSHWCIHIPSCCKAAIWEGWCCIDWCVVLWDSRRIHHILWTSATNGLFIHNATCNRSKFVPVIILADGFLPKLLILLHRNWNADSFFGSGVRWRVEVLCTLHLHRWHHWVCFLGVLMSDNRVINWYQLFIVIEIGGPCHLANNDISPLCVHHWISVWVPDSLG